MANLAHYDYRAVTAGFILSLIAIAMALGAPITVFECHRATGICEARTGGIIGAQENLRIEIPSIEQARKVCHRASSGAPCAYAVELRLKGKAETIVSHLSKEADAVRFEALIGNYLTNKGQDDLRIEKEADRNFPFAVLALSLLLFGLGVRKNLKDKGLV